MALILVMIGGNYSESIAQKSPQISQQNSEFNTVIINLMDGSPNQYQEGSTYYGKIKSVQTNMSELKGIEAGSGYTYASAADDTISVHFPAKLPDPQNPNKVNIMNVNIRLDVTSVETKPDGLKVYYAKSGFLSNSLGDLPIVEGMLEQTSDSEAVFIVYLVKNENISNINFNRCYPWDHYCIFRLHILIRIQYRNYIFREKFGQFTNIAF